MPEIMALIKPNILHHLKDIVPNNFIFNVF